MTREQAEQLKLQVVSDDILVKADLWLCHNGQEYSLLCEDTRTGNRFVVDSPAEWASRFQASRGYVFERSKWWKLK